MTVVKWEDLKKMAEQKKAIVNTVSLNHDEAYSAGARAALMDKEGHINYDLLEKEDVVDKFVDAAMKVYDKEAERELKSSGVKGLQKEMLRSAYAETTSATLKNQLRASGKNLTKDTYQQQIAPQLTQQLAEKLDGAIYNQIGRKDVPGALKAAGADKLVDSKVIDLNDVRALLRGAYEQNKHYGANSNEIAGKYFQKTG